jgi:hypothetical protein
MHNEQELNSSETSYDKIKWLRSICGSILIIGRTNSSEARICCCIKLQFCHVMLLPLPKQLPIQAIFYLYRKGFYPDKGTFQQITNQFI